MKLRKSMESRSTWSRRGRSGSRVPGSSSGAMLFSTAKIASRIVCSSIVFPFTLHPSLLHAFTHSQLFRFLQQAREFREEQRAAVAIAHPVVGGEAGGDRRADGCLA